MHQFFFEKPCYIFSTEGASFIQDFNNFALTIIFLDTSRRFQRFVQKSKTPINDFDIFFHTTTRITTRSNFNSAKEFSAQHYQIFFGTPLKPTKLVCPLVNIIQCFFFLHFSWLSTPFLGCFTVGGLLCSVLGRLGWVLPTASK